MSPDVVEVAALLRAEPLPIAGAGNGLSAEGIPAGLHREIVSALPESRKALDKS